MFDFFLHIFNWVIKLFQVGNLVTRKSYKNDVVFKIYKIDGDIAYLKGINVRLCADSKIDDLVLVDNIDRDDDHFFYDKIRSIRNFERSDYFYIPGKVLHVDADILTSSVSK